MNYTIQVNEVKGKEGNIRAYANIVLDEVFKITNIAIIENQEKGQLFVSMPRYRTKLVDENNRPVYQDICYPVTKEFREELYSAILVEYEKGRVKEVV